MKRSLIATVILGVVMASNAQRRTTHTPPVPVSAGTEAFRLHVSSEIDEELGRWRRTPMPFTGAGLTAKERQLVDKLVAAQQAIENIYWRQSDPEALQLLLQLRNSKNAN